MKFALTALLSLSIVAFLPGCFMSRRKVNEPLSQLAVAELQPGTSTAEDVAALLGAPNEVVQLGRRSAWRYEYIHVKRAALFLLVISFMNDDTKEDRVWVFFDEDDVLTHLGSTFQANDAAFAMPWQDKDELESPEDGRLHEDEGAQEQ